MGSRYGSRVTGYGSRTLRTWLRVTGHVLFVRGYGLRFTYSSYVVTGYESRTPCTWFTQSVISLTTKQPATWVGGGR